MVTTTPLRLTSAQRRELEAFGERAGRFGVNFAVVDSSGRIEILLSAGSFESDPQVIVDAGEHVLRTSGCLSDAHRLLAVALTPPATANGPRPPAGVAIIDLGEGAAPRQGNQPAAGEPYFSELLRLVAVR